MEKSIGYSILGVLSLVIFFSLTPALSSTLDTAQHDTEVFSSTEDLTDIANIQDNVLIDNDEVTVDDDSIASTYEAQVEDADRLELNFQSITGEVTVNGESVTETGEYEVDGDTATVETAEGDDYTMTQVSADEERDNAGIMALVLLIFIVAFAGAFYRAVM